MPHTIEMQSPRLAARVLLLGLSAVIGMVGVLTWAQYRSAVDSVQRVTLPQAHADRPAVTTWSYNRSAERAQSSRFEDALGLDATVRSSADTNRRLQADRVRAAMLRLAVSGSGYMPPGVSAQARIRAGTHGIAVDSTSRPVPSTSLAPMSAPPAAREDTRRVKVLFAAASMAIVAALAALLLSVSRGLVGSRLNAAMALAERLALGDLGSRAAASRHSSPH
ncbi:hypothetical protein [Schauerella aestuarii]|uniref:hypothetical protein n=1 Tax=Schauerella aestuarii TaxID=2511204 RepID=UPI0013700BFD|nr:hypothetical protein [Achromobacter aestuarii]MYZ41614.1 hypothetical protein [Achromobacter aestuarii]